MAFSENWFERCPRQYLAVHANPYFMTPDGFLARVGLSMREIIHNGMAQKVGAKEFWVYNIQRASERGNKLDKYMLIAHDGAGFDDIETLEKCLRIGMSKDSGVQGQGMKASAFYLAHKEIAELIVISKNHKGKVIAKKLRIADAGQKQEHLSLMQEDVDGTEYLHFLSKSLSYKDTSGRKVDLDFTRKANVFVLFRYAQEVADDSDGLVTLSAVNTLARICKPANDAKVNFFASKFFGDDVKPSYGGEGETVLRTVTEYDNLFAAASRTEEVKGVRWRNKEYDVKIDIVHYPCVLDGGNTSLQLAGPKKGSIAHHVGVPPVICSFSGDFRLDENDHHRLLEEPVFFIANREKKSHGPRWNASFCRTLGIKYGFENRAKTYEEIAALFTVSKDKPTGVSNITHSPLTTFSFHVTPKERGDSFGEISALFFANEGVEHVGEFTKVVIDKLAFEMDRGKRQGLRDWIHELNETCFPKREFDATKLPEIPNSHVKQDSRLPLCLEAAEDIIVADGTVLFVAGQQIKEIPVPYKQDYHWPVFVKHPGDGRYETAEIVDLSKEPRMGWDGVSLRKSVDLEIDGKVVYDLYVSRAKFTKEGAKAYYPTDKNDYLVKGKTTHKGFHPSPSRWFNVRIEGLFNTYLVKIEIKSPSLGRGGNPPPPRGAGNGNRKDWLQPYMEDDAHPALFGELKKQVLHLNTKNRVVSELLEFIKDENLKRRHKEDWIELYRAAQTAATRFMDMILTLQPVKAKPEYIAEYEATFGEADPEALAMLNDQLRMIFEVHPGAKSIRKSLNLADKSFETVVGEKYGVELKKAA